MNKIRRWTIVIGCLALTAALSLAGAQDSPRNLIIMIPDGMDPEGVTAARLVKGEPLVLESMIAGLESTYAANSPVTDSAASATAIATGHLTDNGRISTLPDGRPVATIMEAAEAEGFITGVIATSRITHATPACFVAHVDERAEEDLIADQLVASGVDLILGGGNRHFLPDKRRLDDTDLFAVAGENGFAVAQTLEELEAVDPAADQRVLGVFGHSHLPYAIDRPAEGGPSLLDLTNFALDYVKARPEQPFLLMIEGSRIDHAAHGNDAVTFLQEILDFDESVEAVKAFAEADGNTLVVVTSDHGTGGFSVGADNVYDFKVEDVGKVLRSSEYIARQLNEDRSNLEEVLSSYVGIELSEVDLNAIKEATGSYEPGNTISKVISRKILAGWTTGGHSGVDVVRYAMGPGAKQFVGLMHHTETGRKMQELLGLREKVEELTATMQEGFLPEQEADWPPRPVPSAMGNM